MNVVIVSGRLGADPRITNFENGGKSAQFSIAVTERGYKRQDGTEVPEKTDWFRIETSYSGIAGIAEKYLKKGSFVTIEGKLKNREWEKDGLKQSATVIVIDNLELSPRNGGQDSVPAPEPNSSSNTPGKTVVDTPVQYQQEDDLPF